LNVEILNAIIPLVVLGLVLGVLLRKTGPQAPEAPPVQAGM
jgi:hypothetical protein